MPEPQLRRKQKLNQRHPPARNRQQEVLVEVDKVDMVIKDAEKFDNTKPNIILISDYTDNLYLTKSFGPFKVAHSLRQAGYQVAVLFHVHIFSYEEILNILKHLISDKTLFVGFNNMFYRFIKQDTIKNGTNFKVVTTHGDRETGTMLPHGIVHNRDLKTYIQSLNPSCKVVLGGPTAHDGPLNRDFDYVVLGYADISVVNLADHLLTKEKLNKSYKSLHGMIIVDDAKAEEFDFVNTQMSYKDYDCILPSEVLNLEISRGCIFKCSFCAYPLNGKKKLDYIKHEQLIYNELMDNYTRFGVTRYFLLDDTFNDSKEKIQMLYNVAQRLPFKFEWWAYLRLDLIAAHPETIDMMFDSGLRAAHFGIESFNRKSSSIIGKGMDKERLIATLNLIKKKYGEEVMLNATFIIGLPEDTEATLDEQYNDLFSGRTGLDSWFARELEIENKNHRTDITVSEFALNPKRFGYDIIGEIPGKNLVDWKNKDLDYTRCKELSLKYKKARDDLGIEKVSGQQTFHIAGLGFDLEFSRNKKISELDWHTINLKKQKRAIMYKRLFYKHFNISNTKILPMLD